MERNMAAARGHGGPDAPKAMILCIIRSRVAELLLLRLVKAQHGVHRECREGARLVVNDDVQHRAAWRSGTGMLSTSTRACTQHAALAAPVRRINTTCVAKQP